jgi:hypothetical protein
MKPIKMPKETREQRLVREANEGIKNYAFLKMTGKSVVYDVVNGNVVKRVVDGPHAENHSR